MSLAYLPLPRTPEREEKAGEEKNLVATPVLFLLLFLVHDLVLGVNGLLPLLLPAWGRLL